jgi:hypothetical protein
MNRYRANFLNQYVYIPASIKEKLASCYPNENENVRHCLGLIIVNLLESSEVAYSRRKGLYTKNRTRHFTYQNLKNALQIAEVDSYVIQLRKGHLGRGNEKGESSTMGAGPRLREFNRPVKMELDVEALPLLSTDEKPIFESDDLELIRARYVEASPEYRALVQRLDRLYFEAKVLNHQYWNKMLIDTSYIESREKCFNRVGLTRIFNEGLMGRWFQKGEMSYQQLSSVERSKLLLNGEPVVEIDYSAMHPHILYAWENEQCPGDFYTGIMNQCGCDRFVAKSIVLIAINASGYASLVGAINSNKGETERANKNRAVPEPVLYSELKNHGLTAKEVVEAIKIAHPVIAKYVYRAMANKLMLVESDIMTSVLLKLMRLSIPALPVHDSVIVPSRHKDVARRVMQDTFTEQTGFKAVIK